MRRIDLYAVLFTLEASSGGSVLSRLIVCLLFLMALGAGCEPAAPSQLGAAPVSSSATSVSRAPDPTPRHGERPEVELVYYWSLTCEICKKQAGEIDKLQEAVGSVASVVRQLPYEDDLMRYGIEKYPTMIVFRNGMEFRRFVGFTRSEELYDAMRRAFE